MVHAEGSTSKISTHDEPINFSKEVPSGHPQFTIEPDVKEAKEKNLENPCNYLLP